ncbi:outer membrane beta-barrel protein [Thiolinea disciformis]|uniref:outer membrane beta-barrel protein n=1 Tax=Thiolinea disciformis TaxID=125614 RepID=UPI000373F7A8|nr:outer membrane beta-barrel protein [Thiolinea disciformis]
MISIRLAGLLSLVLLQAPAFAYDYTFQTEETDPTGSFYVGAGSGYMLGDAYDLCADNDDLSCITWKGFVGYKPLPSVAIEAGYQSLMNGRATASDNTNIQIKTTAWSGSVLGFYPVQPNIDAFGKLGFAAWSSKSGSNTVNSSGTDMLIGAGAQMKMTDNLSIRGEWEYVGGDLQSTNVSTGVTYSTY